MADSIKIVGRRWLLYAFCLLVIAAGFSWFRLAFIRDSDLTFDETIYTLCKNLFLNNGISPWDTVDQPPGYTYINGLLSHLFINDDFTLRYINSIGGFLVIALTFMLSLFLYDKKVSLLSVFFLGFCPAHVLFSMHIQSDIWASVFIYLAILSWEKNKLGKLPTAWIFVSVLCCSLAFLTKYNSVIVLFLYIFFDSIINKGKDQVRKISYYVTAFLALTVIICWNNVGRMVWNLSAWIYQGYGFQKARPCLVFCRGSNTELNSGWELSISGLRLCCS